MSKLFDTLWYTHYTAVQESWFGELLIKLRLKKRTYQYIEDIIEPKRLRITQYSTIKPLVQK